MSLLNAKPYDTPAQVHNSKAVAVSMLGDFDRINTVGQHA